MSQNDKRAVIMTAAHVVADPSDPTQPLKLLTVKRKDVRTAGTVIYFDRARDIAALTTRPLWAGIIPFARSDDYVGHAARSYSWIFEGFLELEGKVVVMDEQLPCPRCGEFHLWWGDRKFTRTTQDSRPGVSGSAVLVKDRGFWRVLGVQQLGRRDRFGNPKPGYAWASSQEDTLAAWDAIQLVTGP